jgi:hypothetical protein
MCRFAAQSQFEKLVVLGITAVRHYVHNIDRLSLPDQCREELQAPGLGDIAIESRSPKHVIQFGKRFVRYEQFPQAAAASNAWRGTERGSKTALTTTLLSTTVRRLLVTQHRLQLLRRQPLGFGLSPNFVHDLL